MLVLSLCLALSACGDNEEPTVDICEHADINVDGKCDECGETIDNSDPEEPVDPEDPVDPEQPAVHTHVLAKVNAISATCTEDGNIEYWTCPECEKVFSDENATEEITLAATITKGKHNYVNGICSICTDTEGTEGLEYKLNEDETGYIVTGIGTVAVADIIIPSHYNGLPVSCIGDRAFYYCRSLTSVTIPDSVETIGDSAFSSCSNLSELTLGNSVEHIGRCAFSDCTSLTGVTIGDSVTSIDSAAFGYCISITDVYYSGSEEDWASISISRSNDYLTNATIHYDYTEDNELAE